MNNDKKLLVEYRSFEPNVAILNESMSNSNGPFLVEGILQRKGAKNQNGRIYPDDILEREVDKYLQTFVAERRALGELDHPNCISSGDVMTCNGWKNIKHVSVGDIVLTLNVNTDTLEYQPIQRVINEPYKGKMISLKGKNIDLLVTPNHRFILNDRSGRFVEKTAQEIFDISKKDKNPHLSIPIVASSWNGIDYSKFIIDGLKEEQISKHCSKEYCTTQTSPLILNSNAWFSFLGFYLAEGHCSNRELSPNNYGVFITQKEGVISEKFREILNQLSPDLKWNEWKRGEDIIIFNVSDARLWTYLSKLGNKYTKYIPQEIKDASSSLLQNLYDWFLNGDGSVVGEYERTSVFSVSKTLIEDLYEIILKLGMTGIIKEQISQKDYMFAGRLIECENKVPLYRLWLKTSKAIHLDFRFIKIEEIEYDDRVYCITVPNGTFYCRNNNKCLWSGNSEVVNLKNVSHNVISMQWRGDDLVGRIEILTTPSGNILKELFKNKIKVGISSRGMGSLKKGVTEGTTVVGDDYNLVCFDFVSNPSTQEAFMNPVQGQLSLAESVQAVPVIGKWCKTEELIRNILSELN